MHTSDCRIQSPQPQGLYHPRNEHDACGMGLVASIRGESSHDIIRKGLEVLINLTHRGAAGCDPETGDGAGILIQIPHAFFTRECGELGFQLPESGAYGVAMCFLPVDKHSRLQCEGVFERIAKEEGLTVLGWRDTPVNGNAVGREARASQPYIEQLFVGRPRRSRRGILRAPALSRPPPHRERDCGLRDRGQGNFLRPLALLPHHHLQGPHAGPADREVLHRAGKPAHHQRPLPRPPALLHQHLSQLEARPSLPLRRPQRRNQHRPRQHQLDERPPVRSSPARSSAKNRRALSHHHARRQRLGLARQRCRIPLSVRPLPAPRHGHAHP